MGRRSTEGERPLFTLTDLAVPSQKVQLTNHRHRNVHRMNRLTICIRLPQRDMTHLRTRLTLRNQKPNRLDDLLAVILHVEQILPAGLRHVGVSPAAQHHVEVGAHHFSFLRSMQKTGAWKVMLRSGVTTASACCGTSKEKPDSNAYSSYPFIDPFTIIDGVEMYWCQ